MKDPKIKTKVEQTVDGEIEYKAVECVRCGYDTQVDNAGMLVIGDYYYDKTYDKYSSVDYEISTKKGVKPVVFCPECMESLFGEKVAEGNYDESFVEWASTKSRNSILLLLMLGIALGWFFGVVFF